MKTKKTKRSHDEILAKFNRERARLTAVDLYAGGMSQHEIAKHMDRSQTDVSNLLAEARAHWRDSCSRSIQEWVEQELAFCQTERLDVLAQWRRSKNPRYSLLVLRWTGRIAKLLGIDAPEKTEQWEKQDWQKFIREQGITQQEVLAQVEIFLDEAAQGGTGSPDVHAAGASSEIGREEV